MKYRTTTFLGFCALFIALPLGNLLADTLQVPKEYRTIQAAIDAAGNGDVIVIAAGTYYPAATIDTWGKAITLRGAVDRRTGRPVTFIDGREAIRVLKCTTNEGWNTVFENLKIQNGRVDGSSDYRGCGGGMLCSGASPQLTNCVFESNSAGVANDGNAGADGFGGGLYCVDDCPILIACHFESNLAFRSGGGAYFNQVDFRQADDRENLKRVPFQHCTFENNSADGNMVAFPPPVNIGQRQGGGGLCLSRCYYPSNPSPHSILDHCEFNGNLSPVGGGLLLDESQGVVHPLLTNCNFKENRSVVDVARAGNGGGGIGMFKSRPTIRDCVFDGNSVEFVGRYGKGNDIGGGGALRTWFNSGTTSEENTVIEGCTFTNNYASGGASGGAYLFDGGNDHADPQITLCQFTGNSALGGHGGAVYNIGPGGVPNFSNCRFEDNCADAGGGMYNIRCSPTLTDCTLTGNSADVEDGDGTPGIRLDGGGMYNFDHSSPALVDCTLTGNSAVEYGGGIYNDQTSSPTLDGCEVTCNVAENGVGGGIYTELPSAGPTLSNTHVCCNTPDQIYKFWTDDGGNTVRDTSPDLNGDGTVDGADVGLLLVDWGSTGDCLPSDLNCDGQVDGADFGLLLTAWGGQL